MKKVILTLALVFAGFVAANAQVWMGGSLGFNSTKANKDANPVYTYSIAPEVGFTVGENWDIAIALGYAGSSYTAKDTLLGVPVPPKDISSTFSVEPYARWTAFNLGKVGFFLDGGIQYATTTGKLTVENSVTGAYTEKTNSNLFWVGIQPGVKFAASDNITFAARIGSLGYCSRKENTGDVASSFGLNVNNSAFTFGVWWTF